MEPKRPIEITYDAFVKTYYDERFPYHFPAYSELPLGIRFLWEMIDATFVCDPYNREAAIEKANEAGQATVAHTLSLARKRNE